MEVAGKSYTLRVVAVREMKAVESYIFATGKVIVEMTKLL
jgi:hypothetical protein